MDPITKAARSFMEQGVHQLERKGRSSVRFVCEHGQRGEMIKALRLWEHARDNRRPFFLYDQQYRDRGSYFEALSKAIREDYERIRESVAKEGVELLAFELHDGQSVSALPPLERAMVHAERAASLLGTRLDGLLIGLLPYQVQDVSSWRESVAALMAAPLSKRVRLAFFDPPGGPLEGLFGESVARFSVDTDELFDYLKQQASNKSAGPAVPARPMLTEAQRKDYEARTGQKLLSDDEARELRQLVLDAGHHMAKGRYAEAAAAFGAAREQCQKFGLRLEEATVLIGMGGAALSTQAFDQAIECYRQAAEIGEEKGHLQLVAQARLAIGPALVMQQKYLPAVEAYDVAAEAAQKAGLPMLRIEALRMAGTCHVMRGARDEAIPVWQRALSEGAALDAETRRASSFREVATQFSSYLERAGLRQQADHVRGMAEMAGPDA